MNRIRKQDAGFTMVELLIVISIMLILMTLPCHYIAAP